MNGDREGGDLALPEGRSANLAGVVREILATLDHDLSAGAVPDFRLVSEVEALACYIRNARREISELETQAISRDHIPAATDELDAIVTATEEATGSILDCAEQIEQVAAAIPAEQQAVLSDAVTRIYEACNFQDITGQRIGKVVKTLKHIELTIEALVRAFGESQEAAARPKDLSDDSRFLNGPALPTDATSQADIDALLASFD